MREIQRNEEQNKELSSQGAEGAKAQHTGFLLSSPMWSKTPWALVA